ncbi:hypothetical protein TNCV_4090911 [Trichonephila clavipes]|nr:hypothetical protein TNCV_4090911 [Trichonephila clavipes]
MRRYAGSRRNGGVSRGSIKHVVGARRNRRQTKERVEKSLDTSTQVTDERYSRLPRPEDCTVVVCLHDARTVCTFNACHFLEKARSSVVPGTPELKRMNGDEYLYRCEKADSV